MHLTTYAKKGGTLPVQLSETFLASSYPPAPTPEPTLPAFPELNLPGNTSSPAALIAATNNRIPHGEDEDEDEDEVLLAQVEQ